MNPKITTAIVLDKRRAGKAGKYPVRLRVTFQRKSWYLSLKYSFHPPEWEALWSPGADNRQRKIRNGLAQLQQEADQVIASMGEFTWARFREVFLGTGMEEDAFAGWRTLIGSLKEEGRIGTAESYQQALTAWGKFWGKELLPYQEITPGLLSSFEGWMEGQGRSPTTTGIYLRSLRVVINSAISRGLMKREAYPFGKHRFQIRRGQNIKKALPLSDIKKLVEYPAQGEDARYLDLWLFMYLANGINPKDLALLRWSDLKGDRLTFIRRKTARSTRSNQSPVVVPVTEPLRAIMDKWGDKGGAFLFGVFTAEPSPEEIARKVNTLVGKINRRTKRIGRELGIEQPVTCMSARHSFATVLKRSGAPIPFISESLGHKAISTTESYLASFEDDERAKWSGKLLDF